MSSMQEAGGMSAVVSLVKHKASSSFSGSGIEITIMNISSSYLISTSPAIVFANAAVGLFFFYIYTMISHFAQVVFILTSHLFVFT